MDISSKYRFCDSAHRRLRWRSIPVVLLAVLLGAAALPAQEESPLEGKVRMLVRQLNDEQLARREAAEAALMELGPEILDLLPADSPRLPAEVRLRLGRVRTKLEQTESKQNAESSTVTLQGTMPLKGVLAAIQQQTGNPIVDYREQFGQAEVDPSIQVDFNQTPFWEALDQVLDQAKLKIYGYADQEGSLALVARGEEELPLAGRVAVDGPFRIEPVLIESARSLRGEQSGLRLNLEISWEPRLRPISLSLPMEKLRVETPEGQPIAPADPQGRMEVPVSRGYSTIEATLPLQLPPRTVERIAVIEGEMAAQIPGRAETFSFEKLSTDMENVQQRKGETVVTIQQIRRNRSLYEVRILVRFDTAGSALESYRGWILENPARLIDREGKEIEPAAMEETRRTSNEAGLSYLFPLDEAGLDDYRFEYRTPTSLVQIPVRFTLRDIPLP